MDLGSFYHQKILFNNDGDQKISQQAELTPNHPHPGQCECGIEHNGIRATDSNRIVGGDFVTNEHSPPWIVSLLPDWTRFTKMLLDKYGPFYRQVRQRNGTIVNLYPWFENEMMRRRNPPRSKVNCGGSIISANYIITAAHCVIMEYEAPTPDASGVIQIRHPSTVIFQPDEIKVTIGLHDAKFRENGYVHSLKDIKAHPSYTDVFFQDRYWSRPDYDYAILTLSSSLTFTDKISPICLPEYTTNMYNGQIARAAGWGSIQNNISENGQEINDQSTRLKEVYYNVWSNDDCDNAIKNSSTPEKVCREDVILRNCYELDRWNCGWENDTCMAGCRSAFAESGFGYCRELYKIRSTHVCVYGNVTGHSTGMVCSGDSGGPLTVMENGRFAERHTKKC